jgi:hypothetical protein
MNADEEHDTDDERDEEEEEEEEEEEQEEEEQQEEEEEEDDEIAELTEKLKMANLKKVEKDKKKALAIIAKIEQDPAYLTLKQQAEDAQKQANDIRQQMADFMTDAKKKNGYFGLVKKQKSKTTAQRTEPTTTTDIKKDFQNGAHSKYGLVICGVVYPISKSGQYYHLGGALVMCGKVNAKTEHGVDLDFVKKNGLTTLNKLGIFVFGSATNIYTKLRGV